MSFQVIDDPTNNILNNDGTDYSCVKVETVIEPQLMGHFPDLLGASSSQSGNVKNSFCALCLRQCPPNYLLEFSTQMNLDSADIRVTEQKLYQALGVYLTLEDHNVCHTCWKLVQMITDFRECCAKATRKLGKFPMGLSCDDDDEWTTEATLNELDQIHKVIWERTGVMDAELELVGGQKCEDAIFEAIDVIPNETEEDITHALSTEESTGTKVKRARRKKPAPQKKLQATVDVDGDSAKVQDDTTKKRPRKRRKSLDKIELEVDHHQVKVTPCNICSRNFDGKIALKMHQAHCTSENPSIRKYVCCPICTASFQDNYALEFHLNKHKGVRPFTCRKFCELAFASNFSRMKHERRCSQQDGRICPVCGVSLKNDDSLKLHMQGRHGEAIYPCGICGKTFKSVAVRYHHQRVHSDERKYICTVCNKGFKSSYALKTHKRIHTQERPFGCHLCEQAFNYKVLLKAHIERYHGSHSIE